MMFVFYVFQALEVGSVSIFVLWALPSFALLVKEEIEVTFTNIREMRDDNRKNKQRMAQLVRDAEIRWEQKMGVKTNG